MERYLEGWEDRRNVRIPPVEQEGFAQDIIIRKKVEPRRSAGTMAGGNAGGPGAGDAAAVFEKSQEDVTVFFQQQPQRHAYIRRVSTAEAAEVAGSPFVIGKSPDCSFVIRNNTTVSRHHAQITAVSEGYLLEDLGSLNHTFLEGIRIDRAERLADRARFRLSDEEFEFWLELG